MIIIWREFGGLLPLLIAVPALIGGLSGGHIGLGIALLVISPAIAYWGWWINLRGMPRITAGYIASLDDDDIREIILTDASLSPLVLGDDDLREVVLEGGDLDEIIDRAHLREILQRRSMRNESSLFYIPVQYWSVFTLAFGVLAIQYRGVG